jgi:hypothetical protein
VALALLSSAGLLAQKGGGGGAELTVSVTVSPICTVAVTPGEWLSDQAIDVRCRNFAAGQPQPVVTRTPLQATEDRPGASLEGPAMVVINF